MSYGKTFFPFDGSTVATGTTQTLDLHEYKQLGIHIAAGSGTGSFASFTLAFKAYNASGDTGVVISGAPTTIAADGVDIHDINVWNYRYLEITATPNADSATLDISVHAKD